MSETKNATIDDIIDVMKKHNKKSDVKYIRKTYEFAKEKHGNQLRKSGEPYIIHPVQVAYILATIGLDDSTICAALLHDIAEDTEVTIKDLEKEFSPEIIEKAEREGRKFFDGNPQDNYPDQLEKYRKMMLEKQWDKGQDDEELFEYAMHPAQYEAYKSGKAKEDFLADVKKRREEKANATTPVEAENKTKVLTVDVNGQPYRVTVAYGAVDPATLTAASGAVPAQAAPAPVGEGKDVLSPLEGKFFLVKNAQETPKKVGEKVNKGDVICYVEAMKTYNAIRAEYDGTITAICANSGDTVSEDDVLMKIV